MLYNKLSCGILGCDAALSWRWYSTFPRNVGSYLQDKLTQRWHRPTDEAAVSIDLSMLITPYTVS
jgi:hypothetical protein